MYKEAGIVVEKLEGKWLITTGKEIVYVDGSINFNIGDSVIFNASNTSEGPRTAKDTIKDSMFDSKIDQSGESIVVKCNVIRFYEKTIHKKGIVETDFFPKVKVGREFESLNKNAFIGRTVYVKRVTYEDKNKNKFIDNWEIHEMEEPKNENTVVLGLVYADHSETKSLRAFVFGYPEDFLLPRNKNTLINSNTDRWVRFTIFTKTGEVDTMKPIEAAEDPFTTKPGGLIELKCRRSGDCIQTDFYNTVQDPDGILGDYGKNGDFEKQDILIKLMPNGPSSKTPIFLVAEIQYELGPRIHFPPQQKPPQHHRKHREESHRQRNRNNQPRQKEINVKTSPVTKEIVTHIDEDYLKNGNVVYTLLEHEDDIRPVFDQGVAPARPQSLARPTSRSSQGSRGSSFAGSVQGPKSSGSIQGSRSSGSSRTSSVVMNDYGHQRRDEYGDASMWSESDSEMDYKRPVMAEHVPSLPPRSSVAPHHTKVQTSRGASPSTHGPIIPPEVEQEVATFVRPLNKKALENAKKGNSALNSESSRSSNTSSTSPAPSIPVSVSPVPTSTSSSTYENDECERKLKEMRGIVAESKKNERNTEEENVKLKAALKNAKEQEDRSRELIIMLQDELRNPNFVNILENYNREFLRKLNRRIYRL